MEYTIEDGKEGGEAGEGDGRGQAGDHFGAEYISSQMECVQETGQEKRETCLVLPRGDDRPSVGEEVIYALRNRRDEIFYVGKTGNPQHRLCAHRTKFGKEVNLEVLQRLYFEETPEEAERKWINRYKKLGYSLVNQALVDMSEYAKGDPLRDFFREMGRLGGLHGGRKVNQKMTKKQRQERAAKAKATRANAPSQLVRMSPEERAQKKKAEMDAKWQKINQGIVDDE